jgi:peroxiredoxin
VALTNPADLTDPTGGPGAVRGGGRVDPERLWKLVAAVAGVALIGFIAYAVTRPHQAARPVPYPVTPPASLALGSQAPAFALPSLDGAGSVSLAATAGTPTIVNFFASWCRNCQGELASFAGLSARRTGRIAVIGVDSNDADAVKARRLLTGAGATYPVGVDGKATVATSYRLSALPVTYFLDAHHRVVHVGFGQQSGAVLDHWASVLTGGPATP